LMNTPLLPIFRSKHQLALLAHVLVHSPREFTLPDLARATGASQPTVWREVERLSAAGILSVRSVGRSKLVAANTASPYFPELRSLVSKVAGPAVLLGDRLGKVRGVEEAYVFGSWARRYSGETGGDPADVDLLVIGDADADEVDDALGGIQDVLGRAVDAVVVPRREWEAERSFLHLAEEARPLVLVVGEA
jgi:predicted nucleotidyltransferase/biotin operon repressor